MVNPFVVFRSQCNRLFRSADSHQILLMNCSTISTYCPLTLFNLDRSHQGIYECLATNAHGTVGRFYEIDVQCKRNYGNERDEEDEE